MELEYDLFLSYSHQDESFAERLEKSLRGYVPPLGSGLPRRRLRVFRDKSEARGVQLSEELSRALTRSRKLVVICSPAARESRWVNQEIQTFVAARDGGTVIPILAAGLPSSESIERERPADSAFPPSLLSALTGEPWAPDFRRVVAAGKKVRSERSAWYHLLASIYEVSREEIERRERRRTLFRSAVASASAVVLGIGLILYFQERAEKSSLERASESEKVRRTDVGKSLRLAVEATETAPTERAREALNGALGGLLRDFRPWGETDQMAVDEEGRRLAIGSPYGAGIMVDTATGWQFPLCGHLHPITLLAFSPGGKFLITASDDDHLLQIWDTAKGLVTGHLTGSFEPLLPTTPPLWFTPDGRFLLTAGPLQLWSLQSGNLVRKLDGAWYHDMVVFHPSKRSFLSYQSELEMGPIGGADPGKGLSVWNATTGDNLSSDGKAGSYEFVGYLAGGRWLLGKKKDAPDFVLAEIGPDGKPKPVKQINLADLDPELLAGIDGSAPKGWSSYQTPENRIPLLETIESVLRRKHPEVTRILGLNAKGSMILADREDLSPELFSLPGMNVLGDLEEEPKGSIMTAAFDPIGATLALLRHVGEDNRELSLWSVREPKRLWKVKGSFSEIHFSSDGARLVLKGFEDSRQQGVWVYDAQTGRSMAGSDHVYGTLVLFVGPRAGRIVRIVSRTDHDVFVWDGESGRRLERENVSEKGKKQFQEDEEILSRQNPATLRELLSIARRRLRGCPEEGLER